MGAGAKVWNPMALWAGLIVAALIIPVFCFRHYVQDGGKFPAHMLEDLGLKSDGSRGAKGRHPALSDAGSPVSSWCSSPTGFSSSDGDWVDRAHDALDPASRLKPTLIVSGWAFSSAFDDAIQACTVQAIAFRDGARICLLYNRSTRHIASPMACNPRYDILFEPVQIGPVTAPNRFYQVPHASGMTNALPRVRAAFREAKAEGGWGVVCTGACSIHPSSDDSPLPYRDAVGRGRYPRPCADDGGGAPPWLACRRRALAWRRLGR